MGRRENKMGRVMQDFNTMQDRHGEGSWFALPSGDSLVQLLQQERVHRLRVVEVYVVSSAGDYDAPNVVVPGRAHPLHALVPAFRVHPVPVPVCSKKERVSDVSKGMEKGREELTDERGRGRQLVDTIHERQASVCARCEDVC